jgi:hypothetical protein
MDYKMRIRWSASVAVASAIVVLLPGCGGGSDSTSTTGTAQPSGDPFIATAQNKAIVHFGNEAPLEALQEASIVLQKSLEARAKGDFAGQCSTLNKATVEEIVGPGQGQTSAEECATGLQKLAEPLAKTKKIREDTLQGPIGEMRVKGNRAYALYHGTDGRDYAMLMELEDGKWKVAALVTTEL